MPSIKVQAYASGFAGLLWNDNAVRKAELVGLGIDNLGVNKQTVTLYDGFKTTSGKTISGGSAVAQVDLGVANVLSGIIRFQITVPAGQSVNLGEPDLKEVIVIGQATAVGSVDDSSVAIIARYRFK